MRPDVSSNFTMEDEALVRRCQEGDHDAFRDLVARYQARIFHVVYSLVGDRDEADDLAQETFIKAFSSISRFERRSQFYTWLYRIAVNRCLDWLKTRGRSLETPIGRLSISRADELVVKGSENADAETLRHELARALEKALSGLAPDYRVAMTLREEQGLSYEEIAEVMSCSVGTVKSRLFRGRLMLQRALAGIHDDWKEV